MALQLGALRDALIQAGAGAELAAAAAEEVASYTGVINAIKRDLAVLKWMVGFNLAIGVATLFLVLHK